MTEVDYPINKISAVGPGLICAQTGVKSHFTVYTGYIPGSKLCADLPDPRPHLDFDIEGPGKPEPLKCSKNDTDGSLDCSWTAVLPGIYSLSIKYKDQPIRDSPFQVKVEGESILAYTLTSKVEIKGKALTSACKVNEETTFEVDCGDKSIAAGLSAQMAGPKGAKGNLQLIEDPENAKFTIKICPTMKGTYYLYVKIADQNISKSPFKIIVR